VQLNEAVWSAMEEAVGDDQRDGEIFTFLDESLEKYGPNSSLYFRYVKAS
jgi:hypothetical protein